MRNFKQMTAIGLSVLSMAQVFSPVFAEVNTISNAGSLSSEVTYSKGSYFTVTVPKKIELNSNKEASYTISVTGDICGNESVTVTPDSSFTLQDANGKSPVTATVTQEKTKFTASDINGTEAANKQAEGNITAPDLTSGNWSGALSFKIEKKVEIKPGLYNDNGTLLCSWEESGINIETNYTCSNYKTVATSPYYVLTNNYPTAKKVIIPNSVTSIGSWAFGNCSSLASVTIPNSVTSIGEFAFDSCTSLTSVTIPNSVTSIGNSAFSDCSSLTSVTIPSSVTSIGDNAFGNCSSLTSVTIPNGVTSIGYGTFEGCSSLTSVTIPNSVTRIENGAFSYCTSLTSVTIPNSVTMIGEEVFYDCTSLTSVTIPSSVTSIRSYTFNNCSSLTSVTIPNSVTSIGEDVFGNCTSLTSVTYKGTTYTSKSALNNALTTNNVTVESDAFRNTALKN